jgi:hypothetical protein
MKTELTKNNNTAERFYDLITKGMEAWVEAGKLVANEIDANPGFVDEVCEKFPDISPEMVIRFDQIGRMEVHPRLLLSDSAGVRKLRKLPYALQEKYAASPVQLLINDKDGYQPLNVDVRNLTSDQANQVFTADGIRSPAAQRAWIENRKASEVVFSSQATEKPWRITRGKIYFTSPCSLKTSELARILAEAAEA